MCYIIALKEEINMADKILKTRIQLKYDTLANWMKDSFTLKAGKHEAEAST